MPHEISHNSSVNATAVFMILGGRPSVVPFLLSTPAHAQTGNHFAHALISKTDNEYETPLCAGKMSIIRVGKMMCGKNEYIN